MNWAWFDTLARALTEPRSRRGAFGVAGAVAAVLAGVGLRPWPVDVASAKKNKKKGKGKNRGKRRRRRKRNQGQPSGCGLLPSGAECLDASQCCSGTCAANTAFPQFDQVCCRAEAESCTIGHNECCGAFSCECPDAVCFIGNPGNCG